MDEEESSNSKKNLERENSNFQRDFDCLAQLPLEIPLISSEYLRTDIKNVEKMCRICLRPRKDLILIFQKLDNNSLTLADKYTSVSGLEIYPEDGLPSKICLHCKEKVLRWHDFKQLCTSSHVTLKTILKDDLILKIKSEHELEEWNTDMKSLYDSINLKLEEGDIYEDSHNLVDYIDDNVDHEHGETDESVAESVKESKKSLKGDSKHTSVKAKLYTCTICSKGFRKAKSLKIHLKVTHKPEEKPFSCKHCKETFILEKDLHLHSALHSKNDKWQCNECYKEFMTKKQLKRHIGRHMNEKKHKCDVCMKPFSELYALVRHRRTHTGETVEKKHICPVCDHRYTEASALRVHMQRHTGERPCACAVCGKTFPSARLLRSHMLTHDDTKRHKCRYCDKSFRHESTRNTHHRTHTGEKPYICSLCGKTFIQSSNLTLHMRTHSGEKPYSCQHCERKFSSWSTLKAHERIHTGEKPYSCKVCGKRFARMDLSAHMRRHTGETPFKCEICHKQFTTRARLRDHNRVHTGEKPYECNTCNRKYSTKPHLLKHIKMHCDKADRKAIENTVITQLNEHELSEKLVYLESNDCIEESVEVTSIEECSNKSVNPREILIEEEIPRELDFQEECEKELRTEVVVVNEGQQNYQLSNVNIINDIRLENSTENLMSMEDIDPTQGSVSVNFYQLDPAVFQIRTSGKKLKINKITSEVCTKFPSQQ